jgi:hypothetical protein
MFQKKMGRGIRAITAVALALSAVSLSSTGAFACGDVIDPPTDPVVNVVVPGCPVAGYDIRLTSPILTDTNSVNHQGDADTWVGNTWYAAGLTFHKKYAKVGSTVSLSYVVTDPNNGNAPVASTDVSLAVNKAWSGSTASLTSGETTIAPTDGGNDSAVLTATTDADGVATFTLTNTDTTSEETDPATPSTEPAGTLLYSQILPTIGGQAVDAADMIELHFVNTVPVAHADSSLLASEKCVAVSDDCEVADAMDGATWWNDPNGTNYVKYLPAASATDVTWVLKDEVGNLLPFVAVQLVLSADGGENAKLAVDGNDVTPVAGTPKTVDGVTDADGKVTFSIENTDSDLDAESYRANALPWTAPENSKELKANFHVVAVGATEGRYEGLWAHYTRTAPTAEVNQIFANNWNVALDGSTTFYVPSNVTKIDVSALAVSDLATYTVRGNTNLQIGANWVYVDVTDVQDTHASYSFKVVRAYPVASAVVTTSKGKVRVHVSNAKGQTLTVRVNGKVFATKKITKSNQKVVIRVGSGKRTVSVHLTAASTKNVVVK